MENALKKRLIILSDYGLDDAVALVYLLQNRSLFDGIDIVTVAGNSSAECSFANCEKLLCDFFHADPSQNTKTQNIKIIRTKREGQFYECLPSIHGNDHMGDILTAREHSFDIVEFDDYIKNVANNAIVLSLGPCTLTNPIIEKSGTSDIVVMAGMVGAEPNFRGMEFNQALDDKAYNKTLLYSPVVATLDSCRAENFNLAKYKFASDSLLARLTNKAIELATARHMDNSYIYDLIASLYLTNSEIFKAEKVFDKWGNSFMQLKVTGDFSLYEHLKKIV